MLVVCGGADTDLKRALDERIASCEALNAT